MLGLEERGWDPAAVPEVVAALAAALLELSVETFPLFNGLGNTAWAQLSAHDRGAGSVSESPAAVPPSTWSGLNTPPAVVTSPLWPARVTEMRRRCSALDGDALK